MAQGEGSSLIANGRGWKSHLSKLNLEPILNSREAGLLFSTVDRWKIWHQVAWVIQSVALLLLIGITDHKKPPTFRTDCFVHLLSDFHQKRSDHSRFLLLPLQFVSNVKWCAVWPRVHVLFIVNTVPWWRSIGRNSPVMNMAERGNVCACGRERGHQIARCRPRISMNIHSEASLVIIEWTSLSLSLHRCKIDAIHTLWGLGTTGVSSPRKNFSRKLRAANQK